MQSKTVVAILAFCASSALAAPAADAGKLNARGEECAPYCGFNWQPYRYLGRVWQPHQAGYDHHIAYNKHAYTHYESSSGEESSHGSSVAGYPAGLTWEPYWQGGVEYQPQASNYDHHLAYSKHAYTHKSDESGNEDESGNTVGKRCEGEGGCEEDFPQVQFWHPYFNEDTNAWCYPGTSDYDYHKAYNKNSYTHYENESGQEDGHSFNSGF